MIHKMVKYTIKAQVRTEALGMINSFIKAVHDNEPGTLSYESFCEKDGVTFVHFMTFKNEEAEKNHRKSGHVRRFTEFLSPNCDDQPVFTDLDSVASAESPPVVGTPHNL